MTDLLEALTLQAPEPGAALSGRDVTKAGALFEAFGCLVIRDAFDPELIAAVRAQFDTEQAEYLVEREVEGALEVGNRRRMITMPLRGATNDPRLYAPDAVLPFFKKALSEECHLSSMVAVVSLPGAAMQHVHFDHPWLFESPTPTYAITMLIPLLDVTPELGTTRLWPGTHARPRLHYKLLHDELPWIEPYPRAGDAVLMDYHLLHSGRPNVSDQPRPILYNVYGQPWWRDAINYHTQPRLITPEDELAQVPEDLRDLFLP